MFITSMFPKLCIYFLCFFCSCLFLIWVNCEITQLHSQPDPGLPLAQPPHHSWVSAAVWIWCNAHGRQRWLILHFAFHTSVSQRPYAEFKPWGKTLDSTDWWLRKCCVTTTQLCEGIREKRTVKSVTFSDTALLPLFFHSEIKLAAELYLYRLVPHGICCVVRKEHF